MSETTGMVPAEVAAVAREDEWWRHKIWLDRNGSGSRAQLTPQELGFDIEEPNDTPLTLEELGRVVGYYL